MTLANKIVLLHTGERVVKRGSIAQAGSPLMLYHRPNSLFVAEFIGSPKMNILPGTLESGTAEAAEIRIGKVAVRARVDAAHLSPGSSVKVGIRPERVEITSGPGQNVISGLISHIERVGDSSYLYIETEVPSTGLFTAKVPNYAEQSVCRPFSPRCVTFGTFDKPGAPSGPCAGSTCSRDAVMMSMPTSAFASLLIAFVAAAGAVPLLRDLLRGKPAVRSAGGVAISLGVLVAAFYSDPWPASDHGLVFGAAALVGAGLWLDHRSGLTTVQPMRRLFDVAGSVVAAIFLFAYLDPGHVTWSVGWG